MRRVYYCNSAVVSDRLFMKKRKKAFTFICHKPWLTYLGVDCSENSVSAEARCGFYFVKNHGLHTSERTTVRIVYLLRQDVAFILSQTVAHIPRSGLQ